MEHIVYKEINGYFIPLLAVPESNRTTGHWGRIRLKYLKEHRPIVFTQRLLSGKLQEHLADVNEQAMARETILIEQMKKAEGVTEELKARDQMEWIRRMNSISICARECIMAELIYEAKDLY